MERLLRSSALKLSSLCAMVFTLACISCSDARADLVILGNGAFSVNNVFLPNQDFTIEFVADQPATDLLGDPSRGLFLGTTTLTLANPALGVTNLVSSNVNALRQDQFPEGLFLVNDSNPFNCLLYTSPSPRD